VSDNEYFVFAKIRSHKEPGLAENLNKLFQEYRCGYEAAYSDMKYDWLVGDLKIKCGYQSSLPRVQEDLVCDEKVQEEKGEKETVEEEQKEEEQEEDEVENGEKQEEQNENQFQPKWKTIKDKSWEETPLAEEHRLLLEDFDTVYEHWHEEIDAALEAFNAEK